MDIFKEKIAKRKTNIPGISADIKETLSQRKSINEGLQDLGYKLFRIENGLLNTGLQKTLEKDTIDDDSYRCFIEIFNFINSYESKDLADLADYYQELWIASESKLVHFNETKRKQINLLNEASGYILGDITMLKEKIKNSSLIFIQENAFKKPERSSINQKDKKEMNIFLHELRPSLNGIESFLKKIYELGSNATKKKLEEYKKLYDLMGGKN